MIWACEEKRGILRRKEGDGNESTEEKEERKNEEKMFGQNDVDDIKKKGLSADHVYDRATWSRGRS